MKYHDIAIVVEVLQLHVHHVRCGHALTRFIGLFQHPAGFQVADFDARECLALARFDKLAVENGLQGSPSMVSFRPGLNSLVLWLTM